VAPKFEIENANTKISRSIDISHFIVPVRVQKSENLTVIREVLQNWWHWWVHNAGSHCIIFCDSPCIGTRP